MLLFSLHDFKDFTFPSDLTRFWFRTSSVHNERTINAYTLLEARPQFVVSTTFIITNPSSRSQRLRLENCFFFFKKSSVFYCFRTEQRKLCVNKKTKTILNFLLIYLFLDHVIPKKVSVSFCTVLYSPIAQTDYNNIWYVVISRPYFYFV